MRPPTILLNQKERREFEADWSHSDILKYFGMRVELRDDDIVRAIIDPLKEHHRGGLRTQAVNGLVLSGLFDLVVGIVGVFHGGGKKVGTAQLSMDFFKPVTGNRVEAQAWLTKAGGSFIFSEAQILDEQNSVCAKCLGIVGVSTRLNKK